MKNTALATLVATFALALSACSQPALPSTMPANDTPAAQTADTNPSDTASVSAQAITSASYGREDGVMMVNGKPFFMMGMNHVSWAGDAARRQRDLVAMADLGFNTFAGSTVEEDGDPAIYKKLLDTAYARGMMIMTSPYEPTKAEFAAPMKDHPAHMGWGILDDCQNAHNDPVEAVKILMERHATSKQIDPNHLTVTSLGISFTNDRREFFGVDKADVVTNQAYPIGTVDEIGMVYPVMAKLVERADIASRKNPTDGRGVVPVANLQTFKWEGGRYPTPLELNSMTNQSLAAGVKGILYYTYFDSTNDMSTYHALDTEIKNLNREIKQLAPILMNGKRQAIPVTDTWGAAKATLWTYQNRRYLLVLNQDYQHDQELTLQLPGNAKRLVPLFAGRPSGMTLRGRTVSGFMPAMGSHWYEVQ